MANELTKKDETKVSVVTGHELTDLIKPLMTEIYLFDSQIAGTTHLEDKTVLETIEVGDSLVLQREDNPYDKNAILVLNKAKKKLGYIPQKDNIVFARLMDAGKLLKAKISEIQQKGTFKIIQVGIYLVDF